MNALAEIQRAIQDMLFRIADDQMEPPNNVTLGVTFDDGRTLYLNATMTPPGASASFSTDITLPDEEEGM